MPCCPSFRSSGSATGSWPESFPVGQQRMVAIARALMASPRLLILDEPSLGLQPSIVSEVFEKLGQLKATVSILVTEQNVRESLRAVDRGYVLENGSVALQESAAGLAGNPHVIRSTWESEEWTAGSSR